MSALLPSDGSERLAGASDRARLWLERIKGMNMRQLRKFSNAFAVITAKWSEIEKEAIGVGIQRRIAELSGNPLSAREQDSEFLVRKQHLRHRQLVDLFNGNSVEGIGVIIRKLQKLDPPEFMALVQEMEQSHAVNTLWHSPAVQEVIWDMLIEQAGNILDHLGSNSPGIDTRKFAEKLIGNRRLIEKSRVKVIELFELALSGKQIPPDVRTELQILVGPAALNKEPGVILNGIKRLLLRCDVKPESLEGTLREQLERAATNTSGQAVDFLGLRQWPMLIYRLEKGGPNGGPQNPFTYKPSEKEIAALQENFRQITDTTLRKILEEMERWLDRDPDMLDPMTQKKIGKQIESICNQLGQERWWWIRFVQEADASLIRNYRAKLRTLRPQFIRAIQEKMLARDKERNASENKAIYNALFGGYDPSKEPTGTVKEDEPNS